MKWMYNPLYSHRLSCKLCSLLPYVGYWSTIYFQCSWCWFSSLYALHALFYAFMTMEIIHKWSNYATSIAELLKKSSQNLFIWIHPKKPHKLLWWLLLAIFHTSSYGNKVIIMALNVLIFMLFYGVFTIQYN